MFSIDSLVPALIAGALAAVPSLVGGVLSGCGFCLVWYRLRRLEDLSYRDYQTGLRSGRLLDEDLALLGRTEAPIALLLVDLDDFGRFNAVGYRSHGDRALLRAATTIRRTLQRAGDRIYRMHTAGDEFLILLTPRSYAQAFAEADSVRRALELASVPASIGIAYAAGVRRFGLDRDALLELATTNKNHAKGDGKNRVYPPSDDPPPPPIPVAVEQAGRHRLQEAS
jgi:diguanylate cyclase (GGDEF)-like protein